MIETPVTGLDRHRRMAESVSKPRRARIFTHERCEQSIAIPGRSAATAVITLSGSSVRRLSRLRIVAAIAAGMDCVATAMPQYSALTLVRWRLMNTAEVRRLAPTHDLDLTSFGLVAARSTGGLRWRSERARQRYTST